MTVRLQHRRKQAVSIVFVLAALLATSGKPARSQRIGDWQVADPAEQAKLLLVLANQERVNAGAGPLTWDPALAAAATAHAMAMVRNNLLEHQLAGEPDLAQRTSAQGARFNTIAENIAFGPSPQEIEAQWMHSPGHRANILDPRLNSAGIAVVAARGTLWAVEDFAAATPALTPGTVEALVEELLRNRGIATAGEGSLEKAAARAACPQSGAGAHARLVMQWESSDLRSLPSQLVESLSSGAYTRAAVGACPAAEVRNRSFTAYRVAVLLF